MVPLDRGSCVSSRRFAHFFLKSSPLPHKTMGPKSRLFVVVAVLGDPYRRFGLFASSNFVFIPSRGSNERPLSRIRLSPPSPDSLLLRLHSFAGLKGATPVDDSALPAQPGFSLASPRRPFSVGFLIEILLKPGLGRFRRPGGHFRIDFY